MEKLGLGYEELSKINPRLIYASISGFGHTGPRRLDVSYDVVSQAMGGLMSVTGYPDGGPLRTGISIGDYLSGFNATIAILAALYYRTISGEGQSIDISMQDSVWGLVFPDRADYFVTGKVPQRFGNQFASSVPFGSYDAKDGAVIICTIADAQWQKVLQAIGREDLSGDERFATRDNRVKNRDAVDAVVDGFCRERTVEEILTALKKIPGSLLASAHFRSGGQRPPSGEQGDVRRGGAARFRKGETPRLGVQDVQDTGRQAHARSRGRRAQ